MAEYLFRQWCEERGKGDWTILSAGVGAVGGRPAADNALEILDSPEIDGRGHRSSPVTEERVARADVILGMTRGHCEWVKLGFPAHQHKIHLLSSFSSEEGERETSVPDPIGCGLDVYQDAASRIKHCFEGLFEYLLQMEGG